MHVFRGVVTEKIKPDPEDIEKFCLPLEVFDNTDFDERIPSEWAALMPLPCTVFYNKDWTYGEVTKLISGSTSNGSSGEWEVNHFIFYKQIKFPSTFRNSVDRFSDLTPTQLNLRPLIERP